LGRNPASGGNLSFQKLDLVFLKSQEFLYIFFKRHFWILEGSTDFCAQRQPVMANPHFKNKFYFLEKPISRTQKHLKKKI
jgi:hypothetical protein